MTIVIKRLQAAVAVVVLAAFPLAVRAESFVLDKNHTQGEFVVKHLAISKVTGTIPLMSGSASIGDDDVPTAAQAVFDLTKLNTQNDKRDDQLRSTDFFDVAKYPTMSFVAKQVRGTAQAFTLTGDLSFHGHTRTVTLTGSREATLREATRRHITYTLQTQLDRRDWGLNWGDTIPGGTLIAAYEVAVTVEVDAIAPVKP